MKFGFIIIFFIILIGVSNNFILVQGTSQDDTQISRWKIQEWNDDFVAAWEWPSKYFVTTASSYINYTLSHYDPANFTHPSAGTIEIGNLTTQTTNNKTAEVLALSIWGWFPGLITSSSDWNHQKEVAQEAAHGQWTAGSLDTNELMYHYNSSSLKAINFTYSQDPGGANQNTTLIYDKSSGILLEGYTELYFETLYILKLKLVYSDLISESNIITWPLISVSFAVFGIGLAHRFSKRWKTR
ncbi:MAG: hypothetical protein ACFFAJ_05740 [Candidatus Hodarchaeota archaeon]